MESPSDKPERLLSAALRAQAVGGGERDRPEQPNPHQPPQRRLPVGQVLLFAVLLGLVAGGIVGVLSLA